MTSLRTLLVIAVATAVCAAPVPSQTVKVFILAGQSNMEGKVQRILLDHQAEDEKTKDLFKHLYKDGEWVERDDVFIKFLNRKGPLTIGYGSPGRTGVELEFGWTMGNHFKEPVLLIKAAWGGHSLVKLFRSPSAGMPAPEVLQKELDNRVKQTQNQNKKQAEQIKKKIQKLAEQIENLTGEDRKKAVRDKKQAEKNLERAEKRKPKPMPTMDDITVDYGKSYRNMMTEVADTFANYESMFPALKGKKLELTGFVWFQGWNDQYGGAEKEYETNMKHFIADVRRDLKAPKLPFVIGVMGQNGSKPARGAMLAIQTAQLSMPREAAFRGNVTAVRTDVLIDKAAETLYPTWSKNLEEWKKTGSDHGYHYLGSAIWHLRMGKAFGESMIGMLKN